MYSEFKVCLVTMKRTRYILEVELTQLAKGWDVCGGGGGIKEGIKDDSQLLDLAFVEW